MYVNFGIRKKNNNILNILYKRMNVPLNVYIHELWVVNMYNI